MNGNKTNPAQQLEILLRVLLAQLATAASAQSELSKKAPHSSALHVGAIAVDTSRLVFESKQTQRTGRNSERSQDIHVQAQRLRELADCLLLQYEEVPTRIAAGHAAAALRGASDNTAAADKASYALFAQLAVLKAFAASVQAVTYEAEALCD